MHRAARRSACGLEGASASSLGRASLQLPASARRRALSNDDPSLFERSLAAGFSAGPAAAPATASGLAAGAAFFIAFVGLGSSLNASAAGGGGAAAGVAGGVFVTIDALVPEAIGSGGVA